MNEAVIAIFLTIGLTIGWLLAYYFGPRILDTLERRRNHDKVHQNGR